MIFSSLENIFSWLENIFSWLGDSFYWIVRRVLVREVDFSAETLPRPLRGRKTLPRPLRGGEKETLSASFNRTVQKIVG